MKDPENPPLDEPSLEEHEYQSAMDFASNQLESVALACNFNLQKMLSMEVLAIDDRNSAIQLGNPFRDFSGTQFAAVKWARFVQNAS